MAVVWGSLVGRFPVAIWRCVNTAQRCGCRAAVRTETLLADTSGRPWICLIAGPPTWRIAELICGSGATGSGRPISGNCAKSSVWQVNVDAYRGSVWGMLCLWTVPGPTPCCLVLGICLIYRHGCCLTPLSWSLTGRAEDGPGSRWPTAQRPRPLRHGRYPQAKERRTGKLWFPNRSTHVLVPVINVSICMFAIDSALGCSNIGFAITTARHSPSFTVPAETAPVPEGTVSDIKPPSCDQTGTPHHLSHVTLSDLWSP